MENTLIVVIVSIVLLLLVFPLLFFFRRSTDVVLEEDTLVFRYPLSKEEINLKQELKSWSLQEAYFLRLGKIYSVNIELKNGKWKSVSSRFNTESFKSVYQYLNANYNNKRNEENQ